MKSKIAALVVGFLLALVFLPILRKVEAEENSASWSDEVKQSLTRSGSNRPELVKALQGAPAEQHAGMVFLVANMPPEDLKALRADVLLENVRLAYKARKQVPWGRQIPEEIFQNDVLPYANVDEARHPWRKQLFEICLPLVKDCKTPSQAAHVLNSAIFTKLKVRYSTDRKKPHQSPKESIELGRASCTGLSILLSDACRSVAIPARLVGTPLWANNRGNHTWVEVWDRGWHFTGAAEPDPKGLDHGWFAGDAARATYDSRAHAIYAASFRKTQVTFPLVWAPDRSDVYAVNVTARYAGLREDRLQTIEKAARAFFSAGEAEQARWKFDPALDNLLAGHEAQVRRAVWKAYQAAPIHAELKKDFDKNEVRSGQLVSPYTVKRVGEKPEAGWPLFIAMHGGGGAPKEVNDSQWKVMQIYYRDQRTVTGYKYLALRAPNDSWDGFYNDSIPPLVVNLIRQHLLFGDVDTNKIFLMGYSHGGYGAFFIGPKVPDRFAAIHSSAAAPTDGTISPNSLRNTRFTFMIGELDNAYGRRQRCEAFNKAVQKLKEKNKEDYPVVMELKKGFGHGNLPDRDKIKEMYTFTRDPVPRHLTWDMTDSVRRRFFWLSVAEPKKEQTIDAVVRDNVAEISTRNVKRFDLNLDGRLVTYDRPLRVTLDGKTRLLKIRPRFLTLCQSLRDRGDPELAFTCQVALEAGKP